MVGARTHGPGLVVQVEDRGDAGDVHIGFEVGFEGTDVAPVEGAPFVLVDEVVGVHFDAAEEFGQDVVAEVVGGVGIFGVLDEFGQEDVGVEEVDAHGGVDHIGIERRTQVGGLGLLDEAGDLAVARHFDDAEPEYFLRSDG